MTEFRLSEDELERVLARIAGALANPSDEVPTTRCIARPRLVRIITQAVSEASLSTRRAPSADRVIGGLIRARLITPIAFDEASDRRPNLTLYAVGMSTAPDELAPVQLLQTIAPDGIICYMSALLVHALVNHDVAQHHIARLETAPSRRAPSGAAHARAGRNTTLGTWQFSMRGTPYYLTRRDPRYLVAHQRRQVDADTWFRVATLEQTLLDTLHRPDHCGGPTVVMEAWENAANSVDAAVLTDLLARVSDPGITRRAGYLMTRIGLPVVKVAGLLADSPARVPEPLFPGVPYEHMDRDWQILVP